MAKQNTESTLGARTRTLYWAALISAVASVLTHFYLLNEHLKLKFGQASGQSLCNFSETFNCAAVAASRFSEFLGAPMALWGAGSNVVLALLLVYLPFVEDEKKSSMTRNTLIVAAFIALASIFMAFISSFVLARYCPFCILAYILSFVGLAAVWFIFRADIKTSKKSQIQASSSFHISQFTPLLILGAVMVVGVFIASERLKMAFGGSNSQEMKLFIQSSINDWLSTPAVKIDSVEPLVKGASPENAKMTIVEFADYRCIHCKNAAPTLKAFVNAHSDVRLEFLAWPLDGECNTSVSRTNGVSCLIARAVNCVAKSGGDAWIAHDFFFENQERYGTAESVRSDFQQVSGRSRIQQKDLENCVDSDDAKSLIQRQSSVGSSLGLQGTPSIYVNGRRLNGGQLMPVLTEAYRRIKEN